MAGVNDIIFRSLCLDCGAMLTYTEMVSSMALSYKNEKTQSLLELAPNEKKVVVQIFGHEPKVMARQAHYIEKSLKNRLAYIDINMGCPARKITKKGDGASLMKNIPLAAKIVEACVKSCSVPITVKFRKGYNINEDLYLKFGESMLKAGAYALCIHGRYAMQFYKGNSDSSCAFELKKFGCPVILSGDVLNYLQAKKIKKAGIDAVMIGRAAQGNPGVFSQNKISDCEKLKIAKRHLDGYFKIRPNNLAHLRKHIT